jgi:hypothetical protein
LSGSSDIRAQALEVAAGWSTPDAPDSWQLTASLFRLIAGHEELLSRLAELPPDRLPALLASAAIAFLARREGPSRLAGYFPGPGKPQPPFDSGFNDAANAFVSAHLDQIMAACGGRRYQMNEVARCAQVALGITATTAASPMEPVALVDLGTGAGLGLQLDRYRYEIGGSAAGPPEAGLTLACELRGRLAPPAIQLPPVAGRAGIEADPIDLAHQDAVAWLQACAPPEAAALSRLTAAVEVTRRNPERIVAGDAVAALPAVLDSLPRVPVVVIDAYLAVFLPSARRALLTDILAQAGRARPVTWLSLDPLLPLGPAGDASVQGLRLPSALVGDYQQHGVFAVLGARIFDGTSERRRLLARAHPSGQWVEWLDAPA